jgi:hypothetical protein
MRVERGKEYQENQRTGWCSGSRCKNTCLASVRPSVQAPVLPRKKKKIKVSLGEMKIYVILILMMFSLVYTYPQFIKLSIIDIYNLLNTSYTQTKIVKNVIIKFR